MKIILDNRTGIPDIAAFDLMRLLLGMARNKQRMFRHHVISGTEITSETEKGEKSIYITLTEKE